MSEQLPSIGRIVHYVAYGTPGGEFPAGVCRAAIITEVSPIGIHPDASVCVVNPTGVFFTRLIPYSDAHTPGTWHWPERA